MKDDPLLTAMHQDSERQGFRGIAEVCADAVQWGDGEPTTRWKRYHRCIGIGAHKLDGLGSGIRKVASTTEYGASQEHRERETWHEPIRAEAGQAQ